MSELIKRQFTLFGHKKLPPKWTI